MLRRILFFVLLAMMSASCLKDNVYEHESLPGEEERSVLILGFEDIDTRVQLNEEKKTVWTSGDNVSVFHFSDANQKWQYQGKTGERVADFKLVSSAVAGITTEKVVVVYPYRDDYSIDTDTYEVRAYLPAAQTYLKDSYGLDGNIMISQSEGNQLALKSVCGWLKLQLSGNGEHVRSVTVRGNNGEQVAGTLYIDSSDAASVPASDMPEGAQENDAVFNEITLSCPDGVILGSEVVPFYVALPPQTFSKGLTVEVDCDGGVQYCKYTQKSVTIERNTIQPISVIDTEEDMDLMDPELPPYDEIWYTSTTGEVVPLQSSSGFGAKVVSNTYENGKGVIKFDGIVTAVGDGAYNGYSPNHTLETVTIPTSVTSIGALAFRHCTSLRDINLHDDITYIGERAFIYTDLSEVTIPKGLTELSKQIFDSTPLKSIVIPDNIKKIGEMAFCLCAKLETIVIGDGVTEIGNQAFEIWNPSIVSVTLGKNVTVMGNNVFDGCTGTLILTGNIPSNSSDGYGWFYGADFSEIIIGDEVETIPDYAFYSYNLPLEKITIGKSVKSIGKNIVHASLLEVNIKDLKSYCQSDVSHAVLEGASLYINGQYTTNLTIPYGVTEIPSYAFKGCSNIQFLTIPNSVTAIGNNAFEECTSLISVNQAENLQTIGQFAFSNCSKLSYMPVTSNLISIGKYAFYCDTKLSLSASPNGVKAVGASAFYRCENLNHTLNLKNATSIGEYAFYACKNIRTVDVSSAVSIGLGAFSYCSQMNEVLLSNSLARIEESTFANSALKSVIIPQSVNFIDCYAFDGNRDLSSVYCMPATPPKVGTDYDDGDRYWDAFDDCAAGLIIYVPRISLPTYQKTSYWSDYKDKMIGYDF